MLVDDSPVNLARRVEHGHRRRDARAPVEPRPHRGGGRRRRRRLARARAQAGNVSSREHRHRPRAPAATCCPPSSPSGASPTGAAPSASRALLDRTVYDFLYHLWFRCEVEGIENVPSEGGALLVSNHAGALPPDARDDRQGDQGGAPAPAAAAPDDGALLQGLSGLQHAAAEDRRRARAPGQRAPPAVRRGAARARLPRGRARAPRSSTRTATACAASAAAASSRRR